MNIGVLCNLISDLAQVTRPFYSLNSDSVYVMSCIPCIGHFTTKLVLLVYFVDSEEKLGCWPCLVLPPLLTMSYDSNCWPYLVSVPADPESIEIIVLISQPHLLTTK